MSLSHRAPGPEQPITSLLVLLRRDAHSCVASFNGSLTDTTRVTIQALAELMTGEKSVVLDFSRVDRIDRGGAEAVGVLVHSIQVGGANLRMIQPRTGLDGTSSGPKRPSGGDHTRIGSSLEGR
jgi:hypothetical protein